MKYLQTKMLLVGLVLIAAAGLAIAMKPATVKRDASLNLDAMVPRQFGDWKIDPMMVPVPPSPDVQANLDKLYDQIIGRTYVNSRGQRMMLSMAYGGNQTDTLKTHRQEVCYAAQGFEIKNVIHATLQVGQATIPLTRFLAVNGRRQEPVTYWFTMGNQVVLGRFERMMVQLRYGLSGEIPDGLLVRISNISADEPGSYVQHASFVRELLTAMNPRDSTRLVGASAR
jgi:EpsI family protein